MKPILSTHGLKLTKAIEDHIADKFKKIEHLDQFVTKARISLEHDKLKGPERQFTCSMRLSLPGPDIFAEDSESDLYSAIDLVTKKIEQQLRKRHGKFKARKHSAANSKESRQRAGI